MNVSSNVMCCTHFSINYDPLQTYEKLTTSQLKYATFYATNFGLQYQAYFTL